MHLLVKTIIPNLHPAFNAIKQASRERGQAMFVLRENLVGICPKCRTEVNGIEISFFVDAVDSGFAGMPISGEERVSRLLDGHCANRKCASTEIHLFWKGDNPPNE